MIKEELEYRTLEQFKSIEDSCSNGNWTDAAKECIEYGFYAADLIMFNEEHDLFDNIYDIAELVEIVTKLRHTKENA